MWSIIRCLLETLPACLLDLPDLITDEPPSLHVATQLSQRVWRYWLVLGRAQIFEAPGGLLQLRIEAADAEPNQRCFHSVDDPTLLQRGSRAHGWAVWHLRLLLLGSRPSCSDRARRATSRERRV